MYSYHNIKIMFTMIKNFGWKNLDEFVIDDQAAKVLSTNFFALP